MKGKKILRFIALFLALSTPISVPTGAAVATVMAISGCKTSQQLNTYKAQAATHSAVRAAMVGWNEYVKAGRATLDDERRVKAAYVKYQAAQVAVIEVAQVLVRSNPEDPQQSDNLKRAVEAVSTAMAELLTLLSKFGIQPT